MRVNESGPVANRTRILGSGDLCNIHYTTGPNLRAKIVEFGIKGEEVVKGGEDCN